MAGGFGTADVSKNYPTPANTGIDADSYHEDRQIHLIPEEETLVSAKVKETL